MVTGPPFPVFPLVAVGLDDPERPPTFVLESFGSIGMTVEFSDYETAPVAVTDALGREVLLIVWELQVLYIGFGGPSSLRIESAREENVDGWIEYFGDTPQRMILDGFALPVFQPIAHRRRWRTHSERAQRLLGPAPVAWRDFHRAWMGLAVYDWEPARG